MRPITFTIVHTNICTRPLTKALITMRPLALATIFTLIVTAATLVVTLVVLGIFTWLVTRTPLGRTMRACEQDLKMASLLGIDTDGPLSCSYTNQPRASRSSCSRET